MPQALSNAPTAYGGAERSTNFTFTHKVFQVEGACFALSRDTKEPLFRVFLGSVTAALPLATLCSEFGIAKDSEDGRLIDVVEKSLRFVKEIRPGDSIPRELLDGTASWTVEEHHRAIARSRLAVQLASWVVGEEKVISDTEQLEQLADDPVTKARVQNALAEVAEKLGIGRDRKSEVTTKVEDFAREFAYLEALRERLGEAKRIIVSLQRLAKSYNKERTITEDIVRIQQLLRPPLSDFDASFALIDEQTGEILKVLRKFSQQVNFVREMRDDIHCRLAAWDDMIARWATRSTDASPEAEALIKETYRFAAHHFPQQQTWRR